MSVNSVFLCVLAQLPKTSYVHSYMIYLLGVIIFHPAGDMFSIMTWPQYLTPQFGKPAVLFSFNQLLEAHPARYWVSLPSQVLETREILTSVSRNLVKYQLSQIKEIRVLGIELEKKYKPLLFSKKREDRQKASTCILPGYSTDH